MNRTLFWGPYLKMVIFCTAGLCIAQAQVSFQRAFPSITFSSPLGIENAGDGSNRLFVVEQGGKVKVFQNHDSAIVAKTFLDLSDSVSKGGETGLLGLAFHPSYGATGFFYVNYTRRTDSLRTVIARFSVSSVNVDSADPVSQNILLTITQPFDNHNGGRVEFGPDGYLYIGMGDGGSGGDPQNNGQNRSVLLGKILRIDVDSAANGRKYAIPDDNPFAGNVAGYREEIFAFGLRNPWRFSFDTVTGDLWCADVGQSRREEINRILNGGNYGWRITEGPLCYNPMSGCDTTGLLLPVWDYGRSEGASVTGGFIYRGQNIPPFIGKYVYGDFISGKVWALEAGSGGVSNTLIGNLGSNSVTSFGVDEQEELYLCSFNGFLYRLALPVSVERVVTAPSDFRLFRNFPNPFNPSTFIRYELPGNGHVSLRIYDQLGRLREVLLDGEQPGGLHSFRWSPPAGSTGVYYCRLTFKSGIQSYEKTIALSFVK